MLIGKSYIPGGFPVCAYDDKDRFDSSRKVREPLSSWTGVRHSGVLKLSCDWSILEGNRADAASAAGAS